MMMPTGFGGSDPFSTTVSEKIVLIALTGFAKERNPLFATNPSFDHYLLRLVDLSILVEILNTGMPYKAQMSVLLPMSRARADTPSRQCRGP